MSKLSSKQGGELPAEWSMVEQTMGKEFTFHAAKAPGARAGFTLGLVILALCLYWDWLFIQNWVFDREEILPAGIVLFLVILGGAAFGIYCLRRVFSSCSYLLSSDSLTVTRRQFAKRTSEKYLKGQISGINLLYTPPKEAGQKGIWCVVLDIRDLKGGKNTTLALEGYGEQEAKILSAELSRWSGINIHEENTTA